MESKIDTKNQFQADILLLTLTIILIFYIYLLYESIWQVRIDFWIPFLTFTVLLDTILYSAIGIQIIHLIIDFKKDKTFTRNEGLFYIEISLIPITVALIVALHFLCELEIIGGIRNGYWFSLPIISSVLIDITLYFAVGLQVILIIIETSNK